MNLNRQFDHSLLRKYTAVLFVLLMAAMGFVQAVHVHDAMAQRTSPPSHCSLCVVAHHAVAITPVNAAPTPMLAAAAVDSADLQIDSRQQLGASFIRPPPQTL